MVKVQKMKLAPEVNEKMLKADYWLSKEDEEVILNKDEIKKINEKSLQQAKDMGKEREYYDLKDHPKKITKNNLAEIMEEYSSKKKLEDNDYYNKNGQKTTEEYKEELIKNIDLENSNENIEVKFGVLVKRSNLRAFPSAKVFASSAKTIDQDLIQLTALSVGTPLAILHQSKDKAWYYIQAKLYRGWVKAENVAIAENKEKALSYMQNDNFLIVTESRIETEPNPFDEDISNVFFQMGDKIPLVEDDKIPESIPENNKQAQSPEGAYVVYLPVRDENGKLKIKKALIARSNDLNEGYLAYSRENLLKQGFKLLGERYGWGGLYKRRDCSRFILDIYRTVGIEIGRDAGFHQRKITAGKEVEISGSLEERKESLDLLKKGDPIYMKGHVMMYLGKDNSKYYVIHSGSGYSTIDENANYKEVTVHGVFVMDVEQLTKGSKKRYIEKFDLARKFY